ncbi:MAG TPA: glycosyltransferase [Streptosporangiaceae bacterium]|nr:glycosyltransferase [Streptosporangiaceae bacterium]
MPGLAAAAAVAALAWAYLLVGHGWYWRTSCRLPPDGEAPGGEAASRGPGVWPSVTAVVPARDEAAILPETLPALLVQDYPGPLRVVLVDDGSSDGTAAVAQALGRAHPTPALRVVRGTPPPLGWAGKVWAMSQGVAAAGESGYLLFTDADIAMAPTAVTDLVRAALADDRALVSQMALLRAWSDWERWVVPAFVYFFAQLYPFWRVARPGGRTAAAAGGCMLVHAATLASAGGLDRIRGARIDDIALARLLKRGPVRARCWLGFTTQVRSVRPYPRLADLWDMVARSAYTQLRHSPLLLAGTVVGLVWLYLLAPVAAVTGLAWWVTGEGGRLVGLFGWAGILAWVLMTVSYVPVLRLYRLSVCRAPALPVIAALYAAMTVDSARRHRAGRGGEWKGRVAHTINGAGDSAGDFVVPSRRFWDALRRR